MRFDANSISDDTRWRRWNGGRRRSWRHPIWAMIGDRIESTLDHVHCVHAHPDDHRQRGWDFQMIEIETSIAQCHHRRGIGELGMSRHAFRLQLRLNEFPWVESLHFSGDSALEFGR